MHTRRYVTHDVYSVYRIARGEWHVRHKRLVRPDLHEGGVGLTFEEIRGIHTLVKAVGRRPCVSLVCQSRRELQPTLI
jgi:hypothetical protein